jgi:hypothetical protein
LGLEHASEDQESPESESGNEEEEGERGDVADGQADGQWGPGEQDQEPPASDPEKPKARDDRRD